MHFTKSVFLMEGTIKLPDHFLKTVQLHIYDNHEDVYNGAFIIDNDQRNCKLICGGFIHYNIIRIYNLKKNSHIPYSWLYAKLIQLHESERILDCVMLSMKHTLKITDESCPELLNVRIKFGDKMDAHGTFTALTQRLTDEKNFKERYTHEAQALYERYKKGETSLSLSPLDSRESFPVLSSLSASDPEYLGNYIDPRMSHPHIDPTEHRGYYHELPTARVRSLSQHGLPYGHLEHRNEYSFMNEGSELRSPYESMLFGQTSP